MGKISFAGVSGLETNPTRRRGLMLAMLETMATNVNALTDEQINAVFDYTNRVVLVFAKDCEIMPLLHGKNRPDLGGV